MIQNCKDSDQDYLRAVGARISDQVEPNTPVSFKNTKPRLLAANRPPGNTNMNYKVSYYSTGV